MFRIFVAAAFIIVRIFLVYAVSTNTSVAPSCTSKPAPIRFAIYVPLAVDLGRFIFLAAIEAYIYIHIQHNRHQTREYQRLPPAALEAYISNTLIA